MTARKSAPEGARRDIPGRRIVQRGPCTAAYLGTTPAPGRWADQAACATLDPVQIDRIFFQARPHGGDNRGRATQQPVAEAKLICRGCPVRSECAEHAIEHNIEHGIWGGTTEDERRRIRRRTGRQ